MSAHYRRVDSTRTAVDQLAEWGWVGPDVWLAHGIWFDEKELWRMIEAAGSIDYAKRVAREWCDRAEADMQRQRRQI